MELVSKTDAKRLGEHFYHVNDGYFFKVSDCTGTSVYLKCHKMNCRARATMPLKPSDRTVTSFVVANGHNHEPDHGYSELMQLRRRIMRRCQEGGMNPKLIFEEECLQ